VLRAARRSPETLFLGVDAAREAMVEASRRALARPSRGGVPNARFGVLALERAPGELEGLAGSLSVLLPWGSLLAAVAGAAPPGLAALRALCKPGAAVRMLFGYGPEADAAMVGAHRLPSLDAPGALERLRAAPGFALAARWAGVDEVRALGTTWAGKLSFSPAARRFVALEGRAISASAA
jgi:16S rRNA (adenine(1408)-N(1))-methyltransferase